MQTSLVRAGNALPTATVSRHGLVLSSTNISSAVSNAYDAFGRLVCEEARHPLTGEWLRTHGTLYDARGDAVRVETVHAGWEVSVDTAEYDMLGLRVSATDALGSEFRSISDAEGRPVLVSGDSLPVRTQYDPEGRKTRSGTTRDGGAAWDWTAWSYDAATGLNTAKEYADGSRVAYAYADNGRRTRTTWARGAWREYAYNGRGLVSGVSYSDGTPSAACLYADSRRVASVTLSDGTSHVYAYDDRLLCTNEVVQLPGDGVVGILRTYDDRWRDLWTEVMVTNVRHAVKTRFYDSENRVCGYALTNEAGRAVSVSLSHDGLYETNRVYVLPGGAVLDVRMTRPLGRRELVSRRDYALNRSPLYWHETRFDLLGRPTNAVDSASLARQWLYNRRGELAGAQVGVDDYGYAFDSVGNRSWSAANATTNVYAANCLNQYASMVRGSAFPRETVTPRYDADGNLLEDGRFVYAYDAENRLVSTYPVVSAEGDLAVENRYDLRHRRTRKTVKRRAGGSWVPHATHDFTWDGMNIVLERISLADGRSRTCEYFWGPDRSGTEQEAGGVEGLLAVSVDGAFHIPVYGDNANVVGYVAESGSFAAQYVYDPYGNVIDAYGPSPDLFAFGFSTKYHDRETGLIAYQRRFLDPVHGRWLNRDPIEEQGGENLYCFCGNNAAKTGVYPFLER